MKRSWWKWIAYPVGLLLAVVGACWGIGALLPRHHAVSRTALYRQPVEAVWSAVDDMEHSPAWRTDITGVKRLPDRDGHPVWLQLTKEQSWPLEIAASEPGRRIVAVVADSSQGFGGSWTYDFAAEEGGTRVTITERGFVDPPLFRFLARFVFGSTTGLETYLRDLGRKFGETVTPAPAV